MLLTSARAQGLFDKMKQREEVLPSQDLVDLVQTMQLAAMAEIDADGQIDGDQVRTVFRILGRQLALHILTVRLRVRMNRE